MGYSERVAGVRSNTVFDSVTSPRPASLFLLIAAACWLSYRILGQPFDYSNTLSLQNWLLVGFIVFTGLSFFLVISKREIIVNEQFMFLAIALLVALLSTSWADNPIGSIQKLKFEVVFAMIFFIFLNIIRTPTDVKRWLNLVWAAIIVAMAATIYGLFFLGGIRHQLDLISFYASIGLVGLPIAIHLFHYNRKRHTGIILFIFSLVIILFMQSRMALIATFVFLSGLVLINHKRIAGWTIPRQGLSLIFLAGSIVVGSLLFSRPELFGRLVVLTADLITALFEGISDGRIEASYPGRAQVYLSILSVLSDPVNMLLGVGWGNFAEIAGELTGGRYPQPPHNMYLKFLTGAGLLGTIPFFISTLYLFRYAFSPIVHETNTELISLSAATAWGLIMLVIFFQAHPIVNKTLFYILSAVAYALYTNTEP